MSRTSKKNNPKKNSPHPDSSAENFDTRSLSDEVTLGDRSIRGPESLGDEATFGDGLEGAEAGLFDGEMEVVDLEARYTIESTLGKGGMGEVVLATDTRLNRKVAIKRILGSGARSKTAMNRFLTEAQSIAALNHPNIVQIFDYGRTKDGPFLIMEYVEGNSLLDRCREGAVPVEESIELICQLCDGLGKAHAANIIHRDIKPANILLTEENVPKLTDFGLAKDESADTGMTMTGAVLGTLDFMPPEQRKDALLTDSRSDLWSLAATFYQMLTGKSPKIIKFSDVPKSLHDVLGKALEDEKDNRYQSAKSFRDALIDSKGLESPAKVTIEHGDCPTCGLKNPVDRKFCRNADCGAPLEAACLSCGDLLPVWEAVCNGCGAKQPELLRQKHADMAASQAEAESLLKEFRYEEADQIAKEVASESDTRLQHLKPWAQSFLQRSQTDRESELARIGELMNEALAHQREKDDFSALRTLAQVPESLSGKSVPGQNLTVNRLRHTLTQRHNEAKQLEKVVRDRVKRRNLNGLLEVVKRLQSLQPPRQDLEKLRKKLAKREEIRAENRSNVFAEASLKFDNKDYKGCLKEISRIERSLHDDEIKSLQNRAIKFCDQVSNLRAAIDSQRSLGVADGLLGQIDELLELQPDDRDGLALRHEVLGELEENAKVDASLLNEAMVYFHACRFESAIELLEQIPNSRKSSEAINLDIVCQDLIQQKFELRHVFLRSINQAKFIDPHDKITAYRRSLNEHTLLDPEFDRNVEECESIIQAKEQAEIAEQRRRRRSVWTGCFTGVAVLLAFVITYATYSANQAKKIAAEKTRIAEQKRIADERKRIAAENRLAERKKRTAEIFESPVFTNSIGMSFKELPNGFLQMGDSQQLININGFLQMGDGSVGRQVKITRSFQIGVHEVTQSQYERVMGENPSDFKGTENPVDKVSWQDAVEFCRRLSERPEEKSAGNTYRLPTEAEWEYACRAMTLTPFGFSGDDAELKDYGWYSVNSAKKTHSVGKKKPNPWGLYDMHGNVAEWCQDIWEDNLSSGTFEDPIGPESGGRRVTRGGSWSDPQKICQSSSRFGFPPNYRHGYFGFRVVRVRSR